MSTRAELLKKLPSDPKALAIERKSIEKKIIEGRRKVWEAQKEVKKSESKYWELVIAEKSSRVKSK